MFLGIAELLRLHNLVYFLSTPFKCNLHDILGLLLADIFLAPAGVAGTHGLTAVHTHVPQASGLLIL